VSIGYEFRLYFFIFPEIGQQQTIQHPNTPTTEITILIQ